MKLFDILSLIAKFLLLLPFMLFFMIFTGCSYFMKVIDKREMKGKKYARGIVGGFAVISMVFVTFLGKVYE